MRKSPDVKNSLQELTRAINGDEKSTPNPILKVEVILESYEEATTTQYGVDHATTATFTRFSPTLEQLAYLVNLSASSQTA